MKMRTAMVLGWMGLSLVACKQSASSAPVKRPHVVTTRPKVWSSIKSVVVIVLENTDFENAINQKFLKSLSEKGAVLKSYTAITHPSQPNYIALVSGNVHGVDDDGNVNLKVPHIGDTLEQAGKTWKSYAEGFPGNCSLKGHHGYYVRKHEPFISFENVQKNPRRCALIGNEKEFQADLKAHNLPSFSLYVPDMNNDGHDTGVHYADRWLSGFFKNILEDTQTMQETLFVVTFDEGSTFGDNRILTLFVGAGVQPGASSSQDYDHYSLLRTVEEIFGLSDLKQQDAFASPIDDIWKTN